MPYIRDKNAFFLYKNMALNGLLKTFWTCNFFQLHYQRQKHYHYFGGRARYAL